MRMMRNTITILSCCASLAQAAPLVQTWTSSQGAKVMYVQADALPMLDIRVVFAAGSARDQTLPGLAQFTNALLTEGAGDWDAQTLASRVEAEGIQLGNGASRDMAWAAVRTLTAQPALSVAVDSLAQVLAAPQFAPDAIELIRQQLLVSLRYSAQSPGKVASQQLYRSLYGDHPYAHPVAGTSESLAKITRRDIQAFHRQYYAAANAVIALVGDIDRQTAAKIAEQITAKLPVGQAAPALPLPEPVSAQQVPVDFPASQSHLYLGRFGVGRHDSDYFPLYVGNHILGGSTLNSLLGEAVRHQRGLSYSVYSYFRPMQAPGPFVMVAQTQNAQADTALQVMQDVLQQFMTQGPTQAQLQAAKQYLIGSFPLSVASNGKIVEYIAMMGFYALPLDWLATLPDKIAAVTAEQIKAAFQQRIQSQQVVAVVVGGQAQPQETLFSADK
jgi:zinc protease